MLTLRGAVAVATLVFAPMTAWAQAEPEAATAEAAAPAVAAEAPAATVRIPAGTPLVLEITEALSSEESRQEQLFGLRLAEPILVDGREVVPAGVLGGGEVIDAHPSAFGGRQGRLILSGRFLEIAGQRARIRTMQLSASGEDRANAALAAGIVVGIPAFLIQGGEVRIPVGTRATARLAADVDVPLAAAAPTEVTQPTNGEDQQ